MKTPNFEKSHLKVTFSNFMSVWGLQNIYNCEVSITWREAGQIKEVEVAVLTPERLVTLCLASTGQSLSGSFISLAVHLAQGIGKGIKLRLGIIKGDTTK